jgi:hypothetical protein
VLAPVSSAEADEWNTILDLRGTWKIQMGDRREWSKPETDDRKWENIFVPSAWENEGFPGYDGYAWYRKSFTIPPHADLRSVYLHLGYVDDVCEVYLNGRLIGVSGSFPPDYRSAYDSYQEYLLPQGLLKSSGNNVIAVRVYDSQLDGGMIRGKVGLFSRKTDLPIEVTLPGTWKFKTGDEEKWEDPAYDDSKWQDVLVPAYWETLGLGNYDGFGWYRVRFRIPGNLLEKQLVLLLGRIDDIDEAYLNGERIGYTGTMNGQKGPSEFDQEYLQVRAYTIPRRLVTAGENVLAVRVYDGFMHGGIYDGPIGIVTRDAFMKWQQKKDDGWNFWDFFK